MEYPARAWTQHYILDKKKRKTREGGGLRQVMYSLKYLYVINLPLNTTVMEIATQNT